MKAILFPRLNIIHSIQSKAGVIVNQIFLLLIGCTILMQAQSQADKRLVLADQYFASGQYFTAAGLYGQFLKPAVKSKGTSDFPLNSKRYTGSKTGKYGNKTDILFKQAESYRLANYWNEAATLYKECFEKDAAKYATALYWYAICQRCVGNYTSAEESINRFLNDHAGNTFQQEAAREKQTLEFIKSQLARPDSVLYQVRKINTSFGTEKGIFAPVAISANQIILTSTQTDSVAKDISPYHNRLFNATFTNDGLQNIEPLVIESFDASFNQGVASANGNYLYFTQWKKDKNGNVISSIYYATKKQIGWSTPVLLSSVNQTGHNSKQPFCTADGKYLFFASDREGGVGNFDIWYAALQADGTTGTPSNAGAIINSLSNEQSPFYHSANSTLVFSSDRAPGMGGYDLFSSKGSETQWQAPENMGHPINSSRDDLYFFASDNAALLNKAIVTSDRGSECCLAVYTVSKASKKQIMTGVIRDCRDNEPLENAAVVMKDASGKTFSVTTGADGKYSFDLAGNIKGGQLLVSKETYNEKNENISIESIDETNWQTDVLKNADLCIEKKLVIKVENIVTVYFDFDKSEIKERGIAQLDSIYDVLTEDSTLNIQISGYTDGRGSVAYNKKLSDKRAKACADYLIQRGIDAGRISFESFGACCPVEMELLNGRDNPDGRSMNRRALINIDRR